jgi:plasmid stabilization system protein ParE
MPLAEREILEAFDYIYERSPLNAERWRDGLQAAIRSLDHLPTRCGQARELHTLGRPLRQLLYKSHRVIFEIDEASRTVRVISVRHAARRPIGESPEES